MKLIFGLLYKSGSILNKFMGIEQEKSRKKIDNWALIVILLIATAFGTTIFTKNWQYGIIFYLILFFTVIGYKKGWFKDKIFHD